MKRMVAMFVVFLLAFHACIIGLSSASLASLTDAGQTDELDQSLVLWQDLYDGRILTVDDTGNVSVNAFTNGVLSTEWSMLLEVDVNNARLDSAQELVTVAHETGAYVVQMSTQSIYRNISTFDPVNDAVLDLEGDLWLVYFAGKRRADEYNNDGPTGISSTTITSGISTFEILNDGRLAIASYDKKIYVHDSIGTLTNTLTDPSGIVFSIKSIDNSTMLAGTNGGDVHRYETATWTSTVLNLGHTKQVTYMDGTSANYIIGAKSGEIAFLEPTNFTLAASFTSGSGGDVVGILPEFSGQFYAVSATPSKTMVRYFDLDSDQDGVNDLNDDFPEDASQTTDSDGDGYGDNPAGADPDDFPNDETQWRDADGDGRGDNVAGNNPDVFPDNADQWTDTDGDGYGDNINGQDGDAFPSETTQWSDADRDGYGDNPVGFKPDACPNINAYSNNDRYGCPDTDLDGYSNADENWSVADGADALPNNPTQWLDGDGDGYGDDAEGQDPDACPWEWGNSTKAVSINANSPTGYVEIERFGCKDEDGDGWADQTESQLMEKDPTEHFDGDGDGVGSNTDFDDSRGFIQTEQDYCLNEKNDTSEACLGWNNPAYQAYRNNLEDGETQLGFYAWNNSQQETKESNTPLNVDEDILSQVIKVGIVAFVSLTAAILLVAFLVNKRKASATTKEYGGIDPTLTSNASKEALEDKGGLSAEGGVISDAAWDDDVVQLNFETTGDGFDDMAIKSDTEPSEAGAMEYEEESIEDIAGIGAAIAPEAEEEDTPQMPSEAPPLPEGGLPDGWTMDQWRWYGHEWLAKYGKN